MPTTRSSTRLGADSVQGLSRGTSTTKVTAKRRAADETPNKAGGEKRARLEAAVTSTPEQRASSIPIGLSSEADTDAIVPAVLTFSLKEAKEHLIEVDRRFKDIFDKLACKPYENLEQFHPFQFDLLPLNFIGSSLNVQGALYFNPVCVFLY